MNKIIIIILAILIAHNVYASDDYFRIVDGDTIAFEDIKIRLHGIDAPEMKQLCKNSQGVEYKCGLIAKEKLQEIIGNKDIDCDLSNTDRYNRYIAKCFIDDGLVDIGEELVRQGWAFAYAKYSKDYIDLEKEAKSNKRGMFNGEAQEPWDYRKRR